MAKKECELCSSPARMFCESDEASLCWDCDQKVHAANFLVAKHSRTLLCHICYSLTPWKAAGEKLGPTVSVCQACADEGENRGTSSSRCENEDGYDSNSQESESDDGEYYSDTDDFSEDEEDDEEDGENQVVPWSISGSNSPTHATAVSSSGSEENVSFSSSKRTRDNVFESEDEDGCCSSQNLGSKLGESDENYDSSLLRPSKMQRRSSDSALSLSEPAAGGEARVVAPSGTAAIIEKLRRFEQGIVTEEGDPSAMILGLCKLTRD
ncbi:hypothetical protein CDL12_11027 [Handroanthus impetiginosus]|uniref:B box-type domain-containing protein n=1 Tax=Handroanthus impetiginosus TaxID=429701 RepID=A0A2G9HFL6_9LAMI|nr:hypothetical protein CDL12_11027 [Handroanthus impetiginosus]